MISIGGLELSDNLLWENEFDSPALAMSNRQTLLGRTYVQTAPVQGGRQITLAASREGNAFFGHFTRGQIIQLKEMEATGNEVTLIYNETTIQVVIQAGGLQVRPFNGHPDQAAEDYYTGTITMIEV